MAGLWRPRTEYPGKFSSSKLTWVTSPSFHSIPLSLLIIMQPLDEVQHLPFIVSLSTTAVTASAGSSRLSLLYNYRVQGHDRRNSLYYSTISENLMFVVPCIIVQYIKEKNPTRCNNVSKFLLFHIYIYIFSPQGRTNNRIAPDGKPWAGTFFLPSGFWAAEPCTTDSSGKG